MKKCCALLSVLVVCLTLADSQAAQFARVATCTQGTDVFFVLDGSGSVFASNFELMKGAVNRLIDIFSIGPQTGTVVGALVFSSMVSQVIPFSPFLNKFQLQQAIQNLQYPEGGTFTKLALERMLQVYQNQSRAGAQKLAVVITDGQSSIPEATAAQAKLAQQEGIVMASVGIGPTIDEDELQAIASKPELVFKFTNFEVLSQQILNLFDEICTNISPCDGCALMNGVGYNLVGGDCTGFVQCVQIGNTIHEYRHTCPLGLFWDQSQLTCNFAIQTTCLADGCRENNVGAAAYSGNCRMYWTCNTEFRRANNLVCCPPGTGFNPVSQICDPSFLCNDECMYDDITTTVQAPVFRCAREPVFGDDSRFRVVYDDGFSVEQSCPPNRLFVAADCGCTGTVISAAPPCQPEVYLDCNGDLADHSGNNIPFMNQNVEVVPALGARDGSACRFTGNSRLLFWRFSNTWFGNDVCIRIRFQPDRSANPGLPEMLVANNDCEVSPSLALAYDRASQQAVGEVVTGSDPVVVTASASGDDWLEATYRFHGGRFSLDTDDGRRQNSNSAPVLGMIQTRKCALQIGYTDQVDASNFYGLIDDVSVSFCQP